MQSLAPGPTSPPSAKAQTPGASPGTGNLPARLYTLAVVGLATFLLLLAASAKVDRSYTASARIRPALIWGAQPTKAGPATGSAAETLADEFARQIQDPAFLREAVLLPASEQGGSKNAEAEGMREKLSIRPVSTGGGRAVLVVARESESSRAQALAASVAEALMRLHNAASEQEHHRQVESAIASVETASRELDEAQSQLEGFINRRLVQAATAQPAAPAPLPAVAPVNEPQTGAADRPPPDSSAALIIPIEQELDRLQRIRLERLNRYTVHHPLIATLDPRISLLRRKLAELKAAQPQAEQLQAPPPASATELPAPPAAIAPLPPAQPLVDPVQIAEEQRLRDAVQESRRRYEAALATERQILRAAADFDHRILVVDPVQVSGKATATLAPGSLTFAALLAGVAGLCIACSIEAKAAVFRTAAEVESGLGLPVVATLSSRTVVRRPRPSKFAVIAGRSKVAAEMILAAVLVAIAILAIVDGSFRSQLQENPLAAFLEAVGRLWG